MSDLCKSPWAEWETVRVIGRGSFGTVYEIQRRLVDGTVETAAMKVITLPQNPGDVEELRGEGYDDESITATFQSHLKSIVAEYTLMRKLDGSANVVNCKDIRYIQHDDGMGWDIFIRMELLTSLLKALPENVPEETVVRLGRDIASALVLCRKHSIIHRDIKPQNIFISDNADYKLGDFGIAKTVEKTMGGTKIGTYKYMAPEVYNNQPYGSGADIYSLGLVLYWLLNERRMPFMPLPPAKILAGQDEQARQRRLSGEKLPPPAHGSQELKRIVLKACAYDPKDRYHTADEMLEELEALGGEDSEDDKTAGVYTAYADTKDETVGTQGIFGTAKTSGTASTAKAKKRQNLDSTKKESSKSLRAVFAVVLLACIAVAAFGYSHCWFGHKWVEATCTTPRMCTVCGKTVGNAAGHRWIAATYSSPKKCSICGTTEGTALVKSSTSEKTTSSVKETTPTIRETTPPVKETTSPTEAETVPATTPRVVAPLLLDSSIAYSGKDGKLYFHDFSTPTYNVSSDPRDDTLPGHVSNATDARGNTHSYGFHLDGSSFGPYWITIPLNGMYTSFTATCVAAVGTEDYADADYKIVSFYCDNEPYARYETPAIDKTSSAVHISFDVTGVQTMRIQYSATSGANDIAVLYDAQWK